MTKSERRLVFFTAPRRTLTFVWKQCTDCKRVNCDNFFSYLTSDRDLQSGLRMSASRREVVQAGAGAAAVTPFLNAASANAARSMPAKVKLLSTLICDLQHGVAD